MQLGNMFDAAAAGVDISVTALSGTFVGLQAGAALSPVPGLDEGTISAAYYAADPVENLFSRIGAGLEIAGDYLSGSSDVNSQRIIIGQDTAVLGLTTLVGEVAGLPPVMGPTFDTVFNLAVNAYDLGRLSGTMPTRFEVRFDFAVGPQVV